MAIVLREVSDDDLPRASEIERVAFINDPVTLLLFPGPFPPESEQEKITDAAKLRKEDPTARYMQAYDEETDQMVAISKWHIYDTPELAAKATSTVKDSGPGLNQPACEACTGGLAKRKKAILGNKPYILLDTLVTDPAFQGQGAGGLLLAWGKKQSDELGLPIYLASSVPGHPIYQRHGFRDVEAFILDSTKYGGEGSLVFPLMIRDPISV